MTNKAKKEIWDEITRELNAVGQASRSVQEVKDKWKNRHSDAKKEFNISDGSPKKLAAHHHQSHPHSLVRSQLSYWKVCLHFPGWRDLRVVATTEGRVST